MFRGESEEGYLTGWSVGGTVDSESALRSAGTLLLRVRAPPLAPWPDGRPETLRSAYCGQAMYIHASNLNGYLTTGWSFMWNEDWRCCL
ncbi:hypothetical protein PoB_006623300 [Plakobranchus ocellatus]|uniref:Uncharacterized protein n=1 Tax=Plakobranchus ocellatus TaxID=259542 RepID=A0AAV4D6N9_9GAST|nr:hypothetical protein PoB_006623300 [Plakobranchus ocellatus]